MSEQNVEKDERVVTLSAGRGNIYGNYIAPAVSRCGGGAWHIQSAEADDLALCGKRLTGDLSRMSLHVTHLECSKCMDLGGRRASSLPSAGPEQVEEYDRAERLTYCLLTRGSENHQDHNVPGCPASRFPPVTPDAERPTEGEVG